MNSGAEKKTRWFLPAQAQVTHVNFLPAGAQATPENVILQPLDEFLRAHNMLEWNHTLWSTDETVTDLESLRHSWLSKLTEAKMALTPMPEGLPGLEVVAINTIPSGSILIYAGLLGPAEDNDPYAAGTSTDNSYSAREYGNISRFMGHALKADTLREQVTFSDQVLASKVATANFSGIKLFSNCVIESITGLVALREIHPGERVRWDYGFVHFNALEIAPALFTSDTNQLIHYSNYFYTETSLRIILNYSAILLNLKSVIEHNSFILIESQHSLSGYDIYLDSQYIKEELMANPQLLSRLVIELQLPELGCKYMKCFTPGVVQDINCKLWMHAQTIMGDVPDLSAGIVRYQAIDPVNELPVQPVQHGESFFVVSSDNLDQIEAKSVRLEAAGIELYRKKTESPEVYFLWITKKSLFNSLPLYDAGLEPTISGNGFFSAGASSSVHAAVVASTSGPK